MRKSECNSLFPIPEEELLLSRASIQRMFLKNGMDLPAKAIAAELDKGHTTLLNELSGQPGHKIGYFDVLKGMALLGDTTPLEHMAAYFGKRVVDMHSEPDGRDMNEECRQAYDAAGLFLRSATSGINSKEAHSLLCQAIKEMEDVFKRLQMEEAGACSCGNGARG